jgi:hypothetical protein
MRYFVSTFLVLNLLRAIVFAHALSHFAYPRKMEIKPGSDVFSVLVSCGLSAWAAFLLWGR